VNPLRSVGARLSLALALVVALALGVVWVALVPTLERRLVDGKLGQLAHSGVALRRDVAAGGGVDQDFINDAARTANARVVYFEPIGSGDSLTLLSRFDSQQLPIAQDIPHDAVALRAAATGLLQSGRITRGGEAFAEVAVPDTSGGIFLLSASLHDALANVELVRTRVLWAGLGALALSLLVGFGGASLFARRIRRLERAADRIASGDFGEPVVDGGTDELGVLASAFERMRLQLAQLDGARRAFIANASHELRTPIFSLGGFLELMRDEELDEATRDEFLLTMTEQVARLSRLASDLLDLSRLDAGELRPAREPVELAPVAEVLRDEFGALARRLEHPLETVVEEPGAALADRERVLRIGRALVENALLHTAAGTPVRIRVHGAVLEVEDAGAGIPEEHQGQVFTRFTRAPPGRGSDWRSPPSSRR
jgi:two-component system OmpR family sensor kinase